MERNGPGQFDIKNVIGANEWEENIDNNAFTNAIAKLTLGYATEAANILGEIADEDWAFVAKNSDEIAIAIKRMFLIPNHLKLDTINDGSRKP